MDIREKKIAFLGDSITEGYGASCEEMTFWSRLGAMTGAKCFGYGIGGTRIAPNRVPSADPKTDRYFGSRVEEMIPDADIVVVFGGTNDFGHGDAALGKIDDREESTFYGACHVLCRKLLARYPEAVILFMTPLHRTGDRDCTYNELGVRRCCDLEGYVDAITEVASFYSFPVLDLFRTSGLQPDVPEIRERYVPDGLHPNDEGHRKLAERLLGFLNTL